MIEWTSLKDAAFSLFLRSNGAADTIAIVRGALLDDAVRKRGIRIDDRSPTRIRAVSVKDDIDVVAGRIATDDEIWFMVDISADDLNQYAADYSDVPLLEKKVNFVEDGKLVDFGDAWKLIRARERKHDDD